MCGIAGFWDTQHRFTIDESKGMLGGMTDAIRYRGPDDEGTFQDTGAGVFLGHRRLSIVDLSPFGRQPMASPTGRYVIVFNGEVYNHTRLRPELEKTGYPWRGHSDTEVILAAIEHWGLEGAVNRFIGMFAMAVWDRQQRSLVLVRDRLGVKPLYYGWVGGAFVFASELKAFEAMPGFDNAVDRDALCLYMRHNCVPAPHSIYRGIRKLMPGTLLRVDVDLARVEAQESTLASRTSAFWSAREVAEKGVADPTMWSDADAVRELDALLRDAVALRMEADVPLGAFLSGGVDSSTVVSLMQTQSSRPVKTYSIGYEYGDYDEAQHARAVARHLGTDHHELYVTVEDALRVVPVLPSMYDEPFADSSQIPTFLVSKMARQDVTVSLSGDGGDELFGGYNRYFWGGRLRRGMGAIPRPLRRGFASILRAHGEVFGAAFEYSNRYSPRAFRLRNPRSKVATLADMLGAASDDERYRLLVSHWRDPAAVVRGGRELPTALTDRTRRARLLDPVARMMATDLVSYLPDDILTKVDRASMAVSLEARVPILDHRVVEFAWRLPMAQKLRNGQGKWLLRQVLYQYVPQSLIDRPKMGFGVPIEHWLRGPLRDWAESLLDERRLRDDGYFDPVPIRTMWQQHLAGTANEQYRLWDVLMFQAWSDARSQRNQLTS